MQNIILIDYENIQKIDLSVISPDEYRILLFIGKSQNKIPFELVKEAQKFGKSINWIKIEGQGNNALDFHIAYYLGLMSQTKVNDRFIILSKDKGFDPLIRYIKNQGISCRRINSILELSSSKNQALKDNKKLEKVIANLSKITKQKRPRKMRTLYQHVDSLFNKELKENEVSEIIDALFVQEMISEQNNKLTYHF
ncbi:MAG: PIN domain-containing protein [Spirochaetia bacterium]